MGPHYPLQRIKDLLRANHYSVYDSALQTAHNDFLWGPKEIVACLLKLNNRLYRDNPEKNHFHKTEPHRSSPGTKIDFYKIKNAPEGNEVFTKFFIRESDGQLFIQSFKRL